MQYRPLGNSELKVSALSLGTVALGMAYGIASTEGGDHSSSGNAPPSLSESTRLIHMAIESGINFIDTARGYGRSEEVLGHALQDRREKVILATKLSGYDSQGKRLHGASLRQHMEASIATSLKLLRTDYVDLLMLHSAPVDLLQDGEAVELLKQYRQNGIARTIGATTYGIEAPKLAIEHDLNAIQVAYNILDQRMADEILPLAAEKGVGVVVRSVFLKGALTPRANDLPAHLDNLKQQSHKIKTFAQALSPSQSQIEIALKFVLSQPNIATVLVGVRNEAELAASVKAANDPPLADGILNQLEKLRWDDEEMLNPGNWNLT